MDKEKEIPCICIKKNTLHMDKKKKIPCIFIREKKYLAHE